MLAEQVAVQRIILIAEEGCRPAVAALSDMMGMSRQNGAGEAGHASAWRPPREPSNSALSPYPHLHFRASFVNFSHD